MSNAMERYYFYKSHGICTCCGSKPAKKGQTQCNICAASHADNVSVEYYRWRDNATDKEIREYYDRKNNEKMNRYYQRKQSGLCVKCGKISDGKTMCNSCRLRYNYWRREHDKIKRYENRRADNV